LDGQVETRFVIYIDGERIGAVKEMLSELNNTMAGFGFDERLVVAIPVGAYTLTSFEEPTAEEKIKIAGIMENTLREHLARSGKDWPITVKAETGGGWMSGVKSKAWRQRT